MGGALGAIARYEIAASIQSRIVSAFPWGTFVVNVSGCLVMGIVTAFLARHLAVHPNWRFLVPIGFIGAYTTFSSFELETYRAITEGTSFVGGMNVIGSLVAGYAALWVGMVAGRFL
jgi:fluoride exporter